MLPDIIAEELKRSDFDLGADAAKIGQQIADAYEKGKVTAQELAAGHGGNTRGQGAGRGA